VTALRANHALAALAVLLAGLTLWPFLPARVPAPKPPAPAAVPPPTLAPLPPAGNFAGIAERPLFAPSRRPPAAEKLTAATPTGGIETRYRLLGVLLAGREQRALLLEGTHRLELGVGDRLEGFTVARIEHSRVVLTSPAGETELVVRPAATGR